MFLALSDLLGRLKRYLFLIIAYTLGTVIMLLPFNARNSVITPSYARVWLFHSYDFRIRPTDEQWDEFDKIEEKIEEDDALRLREPVRDVICLFLYDDSGALTVSAEYIADRTPEIPGVSGCGMDHEHVFGRVELR